MLNLVIFNFFEIFNFFYLPVLGFACSFFELSNSKIINFQLDTLFETIKQFLD